MSWYMLPEEMHRLVLSTRAVLTATKAVLDNFTPESKKQLFKQIKTHSDLVAVIDVVFNKALLEPMDSRVCMYAELSAECDKHIPKILDEHNPQGKPDSVSTFKRLLLNKCQEVFESTSAELPEDATVEERKMFNARMLGNIRFIGELYKQKMLTDKIMHECVMKFLHKVENPDEGKIECLCKLLMIVGKRMDHCKYKIHMDEYFERMNEVSTNHNLSPVVRLMLQKVLNLRRVGWKPSRGQCRRWDL